MLTCSSRLHQCGSKQVQNGGGCTHANRRLQMQLRRRCDARFATLWLKHSRTHAVRWGGTWPPSFQHRGRRDPADFLLVEPQLHTLQRPGTRLQLWLFLLPPLCATGCAAVPESATVLPTRRGVRFMRAPARLARARRRARCRAHERHARGLDTPRVGSLLANRKLKDSGL